VIPNQIVAKMEIRKVNLSAAFGQINEHWDPHIVGDLNGQQVKLAKLKGEFVAHQHDDEDELFLVIKGVLKLEFADQTITINPGEFCIVPKRVLHKPIAEEEVEVLLFEPASTLHTGDIEHELTKKVLKRL
jgi:mannose-6-phosphate isomerase-like protein (cupin superfamily)